MPQKYKLIHWDLHAEKGDVGQERRAQAAKAALMLWYRQDVVYACSGGGYDESESLEIALLVEEHTQPTSLASAVDEAVRQEGLTPGPAGVTLKPNIEYVDYGPSQLSSIHEAMHTNDVDTVRLDIDSLVALPRAQGNNSGDKDVWQRLIERMDALEAQRKEDGSEKSNVTANEEVTQDFPSEFLLEPISITTEKYRRMRYATGDTIKFEIENLQNGLRSLVNTKSTAYAVLVMITTGLVTIGKYMWDTYATIHKAGGIVPLASGLIASAGGVVHVAAVAGFALITMGLLYAVFKPAVNNVILINGWAQDVILEKDCVLHGERDKVTTRIRGAPDLENIGNKPMAYPVGFFIYRKTSFLNQPVGFHGSTAGMAFKRSGDNASFTIGVDCPNTSINNNSVRVKLTNDPVGVAKQVRDKGVVQDLEAIGLDGDEVKVTRAAASGSTNYVICVTSTGRKSKSN